MRHDSFRPAHQHAPDRWAGTPEEIHTRPATPFVARFTRLAGELPVRVRDRDADGTVLVEPPEGNS